MIDDGLNALDLQYNYLNLLGRVESSADGSPLASYKWLADGKKVGATTADGTFGLEYLGSLVYKRNADNELTLESTSFGGGRINKASNAYEVKYFIADHLSSTRVVVKPTIGGIEVVERNNFLPFGKKWEQPGSVITDNRFRYSGKEGQHLFGLPYNDHGARMYDPRTGRWNGLDPLLEIFEDLTPFNYALNNPIAYVDMDGRMAQKPNDEEPKPEEVTVIEDVTVTAPSISQGQLFVLYWFYYFPTEVGKFMAPPWERGQDKHWTEHHQNGISFLFTLGLVHGMTKLGAMKFSKRAKVKIKPPKGWKKVPARGNGVKFVDPKNSHNQIRIMQGNPNSDYPAQRQPYVKFQKNGTFYDANGKSLPNGDRMEAHIPLDQYNPDVMPKFE